MDDIPLRRRIEILEDELRQLQRRVDRLEPLEQREALVAPQSLEELKSVLMPPPLPPFSEPIAAADPEQLVAVEAEAAAEPEMAQEMFDEAVPAPVSPAEAAMRLPANTELWMGQVWAVRIGVLLLFMGFVFLANYAWEHYISQLGAMPRLLLLTALSFAGVATGEIMRRKPRLGTFGEVIAAGGLAAVYYCAFAAHHIGRLRVIESPVIGALMLSLTGLAILGYGAWRKAAVMCSIALLLSFYGTSMQPVPITAMISGIVVAAAGAALCMRFRWKSVGLVGLLGAYGSFVLWQGLQFHTEAFSPAAWFLCCYWLLFNAVILHKNTVWDENEAVVISSLNHGFLAALLPFHWTSTTWDERSWMVYAALGIITLGISAWLQKRQGRSRITEAHLLQGIAFLTLASLTKLSGHQLFLVIGVKALFLLIWDRWSARKSVEGSGYFLVMLSLGLATLSLGRPLGLLVWSLYSMLLFSILCAMRPSHKKITDNAGMHELMRWLTAFATISIFGSQVLYGLDGNIGALWMIGLSISFSLAERFLGIRFPAKEIVPIAVSAAVIAGIGLCISFSQLAGWVMPCAIGLIFVHAVTHHQEWLENVLLTAREVQGLLLTMVSWCMISLYGVIELPLGDYSACGAIVLMLVVHLAACRFQWQIFALVTPLFAIAVAIMGYPLFYGENLMFLVNAVVILGYAAWLQSAKPAHQFSAVPLLCGAVSLCSYFCIHCDHADIYLFLAAAIIAFTSMRKFLAWRIVAYSWCSIGYLAFCEKSNHHLLTYIFPLLCYAALAYRARVKELASTKATRIVALLITATMAWKLSFWVDDLGSGYGLSILWALLAAFCFGMGFLIKEPIMRLGMLILLLLCMAKILISIWQLGTLMRIASFLITGMIFLLLGYVYNKHPEWFGKSQSDE